MIVKKLRLRNFRNYEAAEISFHSHMNLITGENAQGKTNLLESLVVLSLTKSHRLNNDQQLIRIGSEATKISCLYEDEKDKRLDVVIHENGKTLMVNGQPLKKSSEFIGLLNVVLFSPDDLRIFLDAPRERRKLIDREISKLSGRYVQAMNRYQNLLKERNAHLKSAKPDALMLDTLDEQMIREEMIIIKERRKFVEEINRYMPDIYQRLSLSKLNASIHYLCCIEKEDEESLRNLMKNSRNRDMETHITNNGIHREDFVFELNEQNVVYCASQGQKRMAMLSFKMALLSTIYARTNKHAILLLDDVLSELDRTRQETLLNMINEDYQCILTATEIPALLRDREFNEYRIENGTIVPFRKGTR